MDYLNSIKCKKEPFADTSGNDLYLSQAIRDAVEKLNHSIRLGAGVHMVLGASNTGKSTLIKQLSEEFSTDSNTVLLVINNPQYSNLQQFITVLTGAFKTIKLPTNLDDKKLQESFNAFFYKQCLQEKKNVLLLIDNGHNLPDFCIQALDSLYSHHTDCRRMLQTVICGETSLQKKIKSAQELNNRVVFTITLKPFDFKETQKLIRFHLERAAADRNSPPALFSIPSQWAIYRLTEGNPGRVIDLCHLIVLTLVIEEQKKADWFMTLRCANLLIPQRAKKLQLIRAGSLSSLIVLMLVFGLWSEDLQTVIAPTVKKSVEAPVAKKVTAPKPQPREVVKVKKAVQLEAEPAKESITTPSPAEEKIVAIIEKAAQPKPEAAKETTVPSPPAKEVIEPTAQPADKIAAITEEAEKAVPEALKAEPAPVAVVEPEPVEEIVKVVSPAIKERREVKPGETFLVMIQKVYGPGHLKPHYIDQVIAANPQLRNPDNLAVGDEIFFPVLAAKGKAPVVAAIAKQPLAAEAEKPPVAAKPKKMEAPVATVEDKAIVAAKKTGSMVSKKLDRELQPVDAPGLIGKLAVQPGDTLGKIIRGVYGPFTFNPEYTRKVLAANKQLKNPDSLEVGETIYLPDLPIVPEIGLPAKPQPVASRGEIPEFLGEIITIEGETFGDMVRRIYGPYSFNKENVAKVLAVNPNLGNPDQLSVGQKVLFPTILVALTEKAPNAWWVKINTLDNIQSAYRFLRVYSKWSPPMIIIPSRDKNGRVLFNVLLQEYFMEEQAALTAINNLPESITVNARPLRGLDPGIYYYWVKQGK